MIFVTLGSQKFQFNRLLKKIDELIEDSTIQEEVFAQIGYSNYYPKYFNFKKFLDREEYIRKIDECSIVITHGGTGAIIGAVKKEKKVIAVPRLLEYGEHVDNHQQQLLKEFDRMGIIEACFDLQNLKYSIDRMPYIKFKNYVSNNVTIINNNIKN